MGAGWPMFSLTLEGPKALKTKRESHDKQEQPPSLRRVQAVLLARQVEDITLEVLSEKSFKALHRFKGHASALLNSFSRWRPAERSPLHVSGCGARPYI